MLLAPSPRKASVRPGRAPWASRTVCRSARIWQGWKRVGQRVDHRHRAGRGQLGSMRSWPKVRHTIAATCRASTRAVSADRSRRGRAWVAWASMISGWPPSSAMPTANETRVRSGRLVEQDRDRARPGQRPVAEPVGLHGVGQVQHLGLLGRGQVVVAQEVARPPPGVVRARPSAGVAVAAPAAARGARPPGQDAGQRGEERLRPGSAGGSAAGRAGSRPAGRR